MCLRRHATVTGRDLRGPIGYLVTHPMLRFTCAAAALTTSLCAIRRSARSATSVKRAGWTALAALTALEGAALVALLPQSQGSPLDGVGASA
jgi:hypothetical protein